MKNISIVRTSDTRLERFAALKVNAPVPAETLGHSIATINIDAQMQYQTFEGIGGAFTEAAASVWQTLTPEKQQQLIAAYFDPENGNNYVMGRTHMNSCDFALGNYACCETPGDVELKSFSLKREKQAIIPMIQAAQKYRADIKLMITPWSPPAWMKDSGKMNQGGKLLPEYRQVWANYYCRFIQELAKENITVWGLSVQNEPEAKPAWDSCNYSPAEERDFVRDYLGPTLWKNNLQKVKVMVWDHNRYRIYDRVSEIYNDPEASKYIWGAAYHWYCEERFDVLQRTHEKWPDKKLLFSEGCHEGGAYHGEWVVGERYAHNMINDFNSYCVGWIDWNMVLNEQGGPNHVGNFCSAPILVDTENGNYMKQSSYYYIGHFSRYIQPGAKRILCASTRDRLEATAFVNPDGSRICVILNRSDIEYPCYLKENDRAVKFTALPHSIVTVKIED